MVCKGINIESRNAKKKLSPTIAPALCLETAESRLTAEVVQDLRQQRQRDFAFRGLNIKYITFYLTASDHRVTDEAATMKLPR